MRNADEPNGDASASLRTGAELSLSPPQPDTCRISSLTSSSDHNDTWMRSEASNDKGDGSVELGLKNGKSVIEEGELKTCMIQCNDDKTDNVTDWDVRPNDGKEDCMDSRSSRGRLLEATPAIRAGDSSRRSEIAPSSSSSSSVTVLSNIFEDSVTADPCSSVRRFGDAGEILSRTKFRNGTDELPSATLKEICGENLDRSSPSNGLGSGSESISKSAPLLTSDVSLLTARRPIAQLADSRGVSSSNHNCGASLRKRRTNGACLELNKQEIGMCQTGAIANELNRWSPGNRTPRASPIPKQRLPRPSAQSLPRLSMYCFRLKPGYCLSFASLSMLVLCVLLGLYAYLMQNQVRLLETELRIYEHALRTLGKAERDCSGGSVEHLIKTLELRDNDNVWSLSTRGIRSFALLISVVILMTPFFCVKYIDDIDRLSRSNSIKHSVDQDSRGTDEEVPLSKRVAYRVDVLFSNHTFVKPLALLVATILLIAVGGVALFGVSGESFPEALWRAWTYIADAGNHADSNGMGPRFVAVFISFGGMLIFALMLGLVSDAISEKVDSLRKGKSEVIEKNHILILGWSDKLGSLLKQLSIAHQSVGGGVVVVLAERDKEQMELDIAKLEFNLMGTSVICRSGSPLILADLKKVSVSKARSIIVLAEVENADQSDARALRVVLSLTGVKEGLHGHVVVEISDLDNEPLVKLVGGDLVETVVAHDVIGRLMIQCARQPGLAQIWEDILGFENAEFYLKKWPQLIDKSFEEVLISFPEAIPCGVKVAKDGRMVLNPADDYVLQEGDELLVVAEDEDSYGPLCPAEVRRAILPEFTTSPKIPEKILFCGWRRDIDDMIMVLDAFLAPGSELWMFSEVPQSVREKKLLEGELQNNELKNIKLVHREGNANIRRHLESLPLETFGSILILADESLEDSVVKADSRSLATLLLIRDIQSKRMPDRDVKLLQPRPNNIIQSPWIREMQQASTRSIIISEILDSRTKHLVSVSEISDYVLSNELVSMALAMVAEDKEINIVLEELFAEEGNEMYIRTAAIYLYDQEELSFYDIMVRARQRHEVVIGYRLATMERAVINPPNKGVKQKWSISDVFIVLAEDE